VLAVLAVFLAWHAEDRIESVIDVNMTAIQQTTVATRDLTALLAETPGRAVFLSPDNSRRPVTVDSAIFKGSTSIDRTIDPSGDRPSPLIRKLFADRDYIAADATVDSRRPLDLSSYRKLVFVVGPAPANRAILVKSGEVRAREWATTRKWLLSTFGVQPELFDCDFERANGNNGLLVACLRREETLAAPVTMPVRYVASTADLSADGTVTLLSGEERALDPGEKLIAARTGELFRFDGGAYTRLVGDDVRRLQVEGVGAWDAGASGVSGVTAILRDGAWTLDKIDVEPANPDPWFQVPAQRRTLSNAWSIVPSEQSATVSRLRDSRSTYIRVRPRSELKRLQIKGALPLPTLDGVPVTVRVDFRLNRPGAVVELIVGDGIG
jgi:hypothetical protein